MRGCETGDAPDELAATLVRYADGPDRVTLHPAAADDVTLMGAWLTADAGEFVRLDEVR